jgi:hypothetical protein
VVVTTAAFQRFLPVFPKFLPRHFQNRRLHLSH